MADFFVSYNGADKATATAIATALHEGDFEVRFAEWELGLGHNIPMWMIEATDDCERLIAVCSSNYLRPKAVYSAIERAAFLWDDPSGKNGAVIPVLIEDCELPKLFATLSYFPLYESDLTTLVESIRNGPSGPPPRRPKPPKGGGSGGGVLTNITTGLGLKVVGRDEDVSRLRLLLAENKAAALHPSVLTGLGGSGKTTLARYYIERFGHHYSGIWWFPSEVEASLRTALFNLAGSFGYRPPPDLPTRDASAICWEHIQRSREPWLCVFDNARNSEEISDFLPRIDNIHVIVTSRWADWPGRFASRDVGLLSVAGEGDPGPALLRQESGREGDRAGSRALAEALGGLPLAIVAAGGWLRLNPGVSFAVYAKRLDHAIRQAPKGEYPDPVIGAVKLSYETCGEDARALLDLFAWLATDVLEARLVGDLAGAIHPAIAAGIDPRLLAIAEKPERLADALTDLRRRSLISEGNPFVLHRLSALAIRVILAEAGRQNAVQVAAAAVIQAKFPLRADSSEGWSDCRRLTPHVLALASPPLKSRALGWLVYQASAFLLSEGQTAPALALARAGLDMAVALYGDEHPNTGSAHNQLGRCLRATGDLSDAEFALRAAIRIHRPDENGRAELATSRSNLGGVLQDQGRLDEARMEYESAHMLDLETFGSQSREVGICLNNLASVDWARAEAAEPTEAAESARTLALREARESLDIENAQEQLDSALLGFRLGNLGYYLLMTGALEEAEDRLTEAMARRSEAYANPFHPSLVGTTEWLAICLLIRAARGVNAGARRARAAALAKAHGLDLTKLEARAARLLAEPG